MFYCCDVAVDHPEDIWPESCIALTDNHDGTVSGEIDTAMVGP